ncbi:uncharacterized protein DSM5745_00369 [Aspergillus mulundensis]|uniref:Uncharacterized protein n=1 Tax=Aspergillus mulundensis TaxID=1810919 RepID=A0A3D8T3A9_9EURO|nr:hypothetical protein DSM5745_00369 [Aspergillus mulundensis]RDW93047.1 hypothetical protein DSM5745_00369 [Aspergillus mulundensis]
MGSNALLVMLLWGSGLARAWPSNRIPIPRQVEATATCPSTSTYSTPNGLNFTSHCNSAISRSAYSDNPITSTTFTDCMNTCSTTSTPCYGIAFTERNSTCYTLTNGTLATEPNLTPDSDVDIALVDPVSQLTGVDDSCPFSNNTLQATTSGLDFEIKCYTDMIPFGHYCPWNLVDDPWCKLHTDTMDACMEFCAEAHPLCRAVSWNPDLGNGFGNCYLKDVNGTLVSGEHGGYVIHSALVQLPALLDDEGPCPSSLNYTSTTFLQVRKEFEIRCYEARGGTGNLTTVHTASLEICMDRCASYDPIADSESNFGVETPECVGVVFDRSMAGGYENCALLSEVGGSMGDINSTFARVTKTVDPREEGSGSESKAWIAGPVVGGVAGVVILGVVAWWWRRRRMAQGAEEALSPDAESKPVVAPYSIVSTETDHGTGNGPVEVEARPPQYELPGADSPQTRHELAGH